MALNHEDAVKVASVICMADSGCPQCVSELIRLAKIAFPAHEWRVLVNDAHGYELIQEENT